MSMPTETPTTSYGPPGGLDAFGNPQAASLYVGDLAPDVNEGLLFEVFNAVGPVASIRVCRDAVTRRSLGYGYVNFHQLADAERALDTMNYTMIKSRPCRIMWSQRDPSLRRSNVGNIFVKNLNTSIDHKQLYDTFSLFGNILSCKVVTDPRTGESKGYGYVHYETAEAASAAIEKLDGMLIDGQEVTVGHFMRQQERPGGMKDWTNCYVKNIPSEWDEARLKVEFEAFGEVASATISKSESRMTKIAKEEEEQDNEKDEDKAKEEDEKEEPVEAEQKEKAEEEGEKNEEEEQEEAGEKQQSDETEIEKKEVTLGFGFVNFVNHEDAAAALENLNGKKFSTKTIDGEEIEVELFVSRAQKKSERERELKAKFEAQKMERMHKFQGTNLYVKNLDENVTDDILREEFAVIGTITSARVMKDMKDGERSRGFGFVCFSAPEEATRAVNEMNGKLILNKPIFVALAQRKDVRRAQLEVQHAARAQGVGGVGPGGVNNMMRMGPGGNIPYNTAGNVNVNPMYMQPNVPGRPSHPGMQPSYPAMMGAGRGPGGMPMNMPQGGRGGAVPYPMPVYGVMPQGGRGGGRGSGANGRGGAPNGGRGGRGGPNPNNPNNNGNIKFNQQARNAAMPPNAQPPQAAAPPVQQVSPPSEPATLTPAALAAASPEMQKNMIGERLYPLIHASQPELAGKITGMLLEMDNSELLHLLESPDALGSKIKEALAVLEAHQAS